MNKKKILSLLATFMTGLSLAPSSRSMAVWEVPKEFLGYQKTDLDMSGFTDHFVNVIKASSKLDENLINNNISIMHIPIKFESSKMGNMLGWGGWANTYWAYVNRFKQYIQKKGIQISEEGFLLDTNLNFVDPSGTKVDLSNENATAYKVDVGLKDFATKADRMLNDKLSSLEGVEYVENYDDEFFGDLIKEKREIFKIDNGNNRFYLAYKENDQVHILKNSNNRIESVKLDDEGVTQANKNEFTFNADYLKFSYNEADANFANSVKEKFEEEKTEEKKDKTKEEIKEEIKEEKTENDEIKEEKNEKDETNEEIKKEIKKEINEEKTENDEINEEIKKEIKKEINEEKTENDEINKEKDEKIKDEKKEKVNEEEKEGQPRKKWEWWQKASKKKKTALIVSALAAMGYSLHEIHELIEKYNSSSEYNVYDDDFYDDFYDDDFFLNNRKELDVSE